MNSVSEQIDERILRLLGLEDVFDLDYDTYMTLLKEAIVVGRDKIPQEELALLANERKKIRGKKGRFKPKTKKITADKITTTKFLKPSKKTLALPSSQSSSTIIQDSSNNLSVLENPLRSIAKTLESILKFNKKTNEEERREKESQKRTKREESLEGFGKGISAVSGAAKKMLAPFQSIIDRIWRFIFFTLLGRAFTQLMGWLGDPANKRKIEVLGRFLKDWWPSLAFAAGLFLTPFGGFIRKTIGLLRGFIPPILKIIPQLTRFAMANPGTIPIVAATVGGVAKIKESERMKLLTQESQKEIDKTLKSKDAPWYQKLGSFFAGQSLNAPGGPVNPIGLPSPGAGYASGGIIPRFTKGGINPKLFDTGYEGIDASTGVRVSGFGPDTQQIIAKPGEIVINKPAVDAVGADHFLGLNRMYGGPGANKPKMGRIQTASGGGMVLQKFQSGGMVGPNISNADYNTLLAISALEDDKAQGRADVAQSLYNRLYASSKYKTNFSQTSNTLKGLITASRQYHPTFSNRKDWLNISDRNSAALAIMNSEKGKRYKWGIKEAMMQLDATEKALKNPSLQSSAQKHVGGRAYFLGTSEQGNMKPGDVLRGPSSNFFSPWYLEGTQYDKDRRSVAAPIPSMLLPKVNKKTKGPKSKAKPNSFWANFASMMPTSLPFRGGGLIKESTGMNIPGATADRQLAAVHPGEYVLPAGTVSKLGVPWIDNIVAMTDQDSTPAKLGKKPVNRPNITPLPRAGSGSMMTLPPIFQSSGSYGGTNQMVTKQVPSFSAISPSSMVERSINADIYGIVE